MSLYDKYFSKRNKNHMYDLIIQMIKKETGENIENNVDYLKIYRTHYPLVFENINTDTIIDLNKALLDTVCDIIIKDIQGKYKQQKISIQEEKKSEINEELNQRVFIIDSSKRSEGNRYNYSLFLPESTETCILDEIKLPYEKNSLFANPDITVEINGTSIYCSMKDKQQFNHREYMIYKPSLPLQIPIHSKEITIKLLNNFQMNVMDTPDIYPIQKMKEIIYQNEGILCIVLPTQNHDILKGDSIGLFKKDQIKYVTSIIGVDDTYLLCRKLHNYQPDDYQLMNLSLQNTIQIIH